MIRLAKKEDISVLNQLIELSARTLSKEDYSTEEIESAVQYVFGVDSELIEDQTYYLIENNKIPVACGGWSKRKTLFGGNQFDQRDSSYLNPQSDPAKIRAFFVHPSFARRGLGAELLRYCEQQARLQGFTTIEMMATLPGVKLYSQFGYCISDIVDQELPNGVILRFKRMVKDIKTEPTCIY